MPLLQEDFVNCMGYLPQTAAGAIAMEAASLLFSLTWAGNEPTLEGTRLPRDPDTGFWDSLTEGLFFQGTGFQNWGISEARKRAQCVASPWREER